MSEDLSSTAKINIAVNSSDISLLVTALGALDEESTAADSGITRLTQTLLKAESGFAGLEGVTQAGIQNVKVYADGFEKLTTALNKFVAEQKLAMQESAIFANSTDATQGLDRTGVTGLSDSALAGHVNTIQAANFNPQTALLQEQSTRNQAAALKDAETSSRNYNTASVQMDAEIAANEAASKSFSAQLRAQLQAEEDAKKGLDGMSGAYSLLNSSFSLGLVGAGLLKITKSAIDAAVTYQQSFAQVERTTGVTGVAADHLKQQLIDLSTTMPISFDQISSIAALGGQLGISQNQIVGFTKATAELSATSNLTIEAAGTSIARLTQLIPNAQGQFAQVASSILKVGVTSLATESQITGIATNIASIGASAGLTAPQIIGLSGAFASLGIQSELARGTTTRLFTKIETSVSSGGAALQAFGKISGESGAQFAQDWSTDKQATLLKLFSSINEQGPNAIAALQELGFTSARDVPTLLKLAQNGALVADAFKQASAGFGNTATLTDQYGNIVGTTAAQLAILHNNFEAFLNAVGTSAGPIAGLVTGLSSFVKALTDVTQSPAGQTIAGIVLAGVALTGVLATLAGIAAAGAGSLLLMKGAVDALNLSEERAAIASTAMKVALIGTGIGAAVVIFGTITAAVLQMSGAFSTASDKAQAFFGDSSTLASAFQADAAAYQKTGTEIASLSVSTQGAIASTSAWAGSTGSATTAQSGLGSTVKSTTNAISDQTLAYGANAKAAIASMLQQSKGYQDLFKNQELLTNLKSVGGSLNGFTEAILGNPETGAQDYINKLQAAFKKKLTNGIDLSQTRGGGVIDQRTLGAFKALQDAADGVQGQLSSASATMQAYSATTQGATNSTNDLNSSITNADGSTELLSKQVLANITQLYAGVNASQTLSDSTYALGQAFVTSGAASAASGSAIQKVITDIVNSSSTTGEAANRMQGLFDALTKGGFASAKQLDLLRQEISSLGGATDSTAFSLQPFTAGMEQAQAAAAKTAAQTAKATQQIVTLVDYANNLSGVIKRAFDIRFSADQGLDAISTAWAAIKKNVSDADKAIAAAHATLATLASDRKIDEYWLKVANSYGDTLRASQIQADLAKNSTDTATAQSSLATAQDSASTALDGNSKAAIANRSTLLGLVSNYETYISSLAASGASQETLKAKSAQLKQEFIAQATQLGYNRTDVEKYAVSFDDMSLAIQKVPRNITVTANANPALQALAEFQAKAAAAAKTGVTIPIKTNYNGSGDNLAQIALAKAARGEQIKNQINQLSNDLNNNPQFKAGQSSNAVQSYINQIASLTAKLNSGSYYTGGYTGDGGMYDFAGSVHKGEFVFDQAATRNIGPANLAALHSMAQTGGSVSIGGGSAAGGGPMDLSMGTIQAIAEAVAQIRFVIPGQAIARATTSHNVRATNRGQ